jgi:hypothetical protein
MALAQDCHGDSRQALPPKASNPAPGAVTLPKILKARVFVRIGEFHSARKQASGRAGGMRDAGAGGEGSLSACASSACPPATLAAEALFEV